MSEYDSTQDTLDHIGKVQARVGEVITNLQQRATNHDLSKLSEPEKSCYDSFVPLLKAVTFGSEEYNRVRAAMGEGLQHHYQHNSHHPEHHADGISGMSLLDLLEMLADWDATAKRSGKPVDLGVQRQRFDIDDQLFTILQNTVRELGW